MLTMKKNKLLIPGIIIAILLLWGSLVTLDIQNGYKTLSSADTVEFRKVTFANCQNLLGKAVVFNGTVLFEECGKNCLGGCPNSGPNVCFYGIQDADHCIVYLKSRTDSTGVGYLDGIERAFFNKYKLGQQVEVNGNISIYYSVYCNPDYPERKKVPECSYFVLGDVW